MSLRTKPWFAPLVVFALALALRVAYVHQSGRELGLDLDRLTQLDTYVFAEWAQVIAEGDLLCWKQPHAYHLWTEDVAPESKWLEWYGGERTYHQAPLYPYVVAAVAWALQPGQETLGYVQSVLGALTCALTLVLARRLVSPLAGWVAGLSLAFMAQFYFYDAFTLRDGPLALLTVVLALALEGAVRRGRARDWLLAGAALGLFTLAKETGMPLLALALLALAWAWRREPARLLRAAVLLLAGWGAVTAPAFARNAYVGAPTFKLSTRGPEVLVVGNASGQDGIGWDVPADTMREILMDANFSLARTAQLVLLSHRADPWGFVRLQWDKTAAFFNGYEVPNNADFYLHRALLPTLRVGAVSWGLLSSLALLGMLLGLARRRELAVPYLLFLALAASVIALYILGRFRVHVVPLLALFAALAVDWVVRAVRARRQAALLLAALPLALFGSWTRPQGPAGIFYEGEAEKGKNTRMLMLLHKAGNSARAQVFHERLKASLGPEAPQTANLRYVPDERTTEGMLVAMDEALARFRAAEAWSDDRAEHHLERGRGFAALVVVADRYERTELSNLAREQFELALAADPQIAGARRGLAQLHARAGHHGQALAALRDELELHPDDAQAHRDAGFLRLHAFKDELGALKDFRSASWLGLNDDARLLAWMASLEVNSQYASLPPLRLGGTEQPLHDPVLGLRHARAALALLPDDPVVMERSAVALYANGLFDEAVALLARVAELLPWRKAELDHRAAQYLIVKAKQAAAAGGTPPPAGGSESPP